MEVWALTKGQDRNCRYRHSLEMGVSGMGSGGLRGGGDRNKFAFEDVGIWFRITVFWFESENVTSVVGVVCV